MWAVIEGKTSMPVLSDEAVRIGDHCSHRAAAKGGSTTAPPHKLLQYLCTGTNKILFRINHLTHFHRTQENLCESLLIIVIPNEKEHQNRLEHWVGC